MKTGPEMNVGICLTTDYPCGFRYLDVSTTAKSFADFKDLAGTVVGAPVDATWCTIFVQDQAINMLDDGGTPTTSLGFPFAAGTLFNYSAAIAAIKFIAKTGTARIFANFYK